MPAIVASKEGEILGRVIRPETGDLAPEVAKFFLDVDFSAEDRQRIALLRAKAREDMLSEEEDAELDEYGEVGRLLELLRAKAKVSLLGLDEG